MTALWPIKDKLLFQDFHLDIDNMGTFLIRDDLTLREYPAERAFGHRFFNGLVSMVDAGYVCADHTHKLTYPIRYLVIFSIQDY